MAKKTPIEKLQETIAKELQKYGNEVDENLDAVTKKVARSGKTALKQVSKQNFKEHGGKYAEGWDVAFEKDGNATHATIYNKKYGMPHLLENPHVVRNGTKRVVGTYLGREHIKPVADELTTSFVEEVLNKL